MAWVSWSTMTKHASEWGMGFRDVQCYNDVFLAKLSWKVINHPESLMCRILLGKYCSTESFLKVENRNNESHGWRGVLIGRDLIRAKTGWTVGDGKSIEV